MKNLFLFLFLLVVFTSKAQDNRVSGLNSRQFTKYWKVESESPDYKVTFQGDTAEIVSPKGLTLWRKEKMSGKVTIEYDACVVVESDGDRLSDLNCFWMACHMLEKDGLKYELWIIGGQEPWGDEHNKLYRAHKRLNLKNVKFIGPRNNPYKYMRAADWFLSSSIFEGYSLVSQEAAVLDTPMLLTDCSGVRELLGDSEYGIVMETSVVGIYEGMKKVIENQQDMAAKHYIFQCEALQDKK